MYVRGAGVHCIAPRSLKRPISFSSVSISFVSLAGILNTVETCLASSKRVMTLVGPRFRTKHRGIKGGNIIQRGDARRRMVRGIARFTMSVKFSMLRVAFSPVGKPRKGVRCLMRLGGYPRRRTGVRAGRLSRMISRTFTTLTGWGNSNVRSFCVVAGRLGSESCSIAVRVGSCVREGNGHIVLTRGSRRKFVIPKAVPRSISYKLILNKSKALVHTVHSLRKGGLPLLKVGVKALKCLTSMRLGSCGSTVSELYRRRPGIRGHVVLRKAVSSNRGSLTMGSVILAERKGLHVIRFGICIGKALLGACRTSNIVVYAPAKDAKCGLSTNKPIMRPATDLVIVAPVYSRTLGADDIILSTRSSIRIRVYRNHCKERRGMTLYCSNTMRERLIDKSEIGVEGSSTGTRLMGLDRRDFVVAVHRGVGKG